ncbi:MAG: HEAT repeat domain-containing protein [Sphingosinicella sp.]|nr:HEAT repeat domain-containing protein [Sphingosinicella sp.]
MSLVLSAVAVLIMMGLVIARWIGVRRGRSREAERRRLIPLLLGIERSGGDYGQVEKAADLLADLATELIEMVRGEDKEAFIESATRLGVPERLQHRLDRGSPRVRLAAAEALGFFEDEKSIARLRGALDDPNPDVRLAAAISLASAGHAPPAVELVEKLGIGTRENSALVVGLFRDIAVKHPDEIRGLIESEQVNGRVKAAAIEALSASGDYSLVPLVANLVLAADPDAEELPRYLRALGDFGHPAAARAVHHALGSKLWWVRSAAAEAAGRIGLNDVAERLRTLLSDPVWWVRFRAAEALIRLGDEGRELLIATAESGSEPACSAARLTLAERGLV